MLARFSAASASLSLGTTALTSPQSSAIAAGTRSPNMSISAARLCPIASGSMTLDPASGHRPMLTKGTENSAFSAATT
jgi:hypothetical protein